MEIYFKNLTPEEDTAQKLLRDLRTLRADAEELFRATGGRLALESKEKFLHAVDRVKETCNDIKEKAVAEAEVTQQVVRTYPISAVGIALALGILIGLSVRRR